MVRTSSLVAVALASILLASTAVAANVTWDTVPGTVGPGNGTVTGGIGTWNTTNGNWTVDGGANNIAWVNGNNDTAIFGAVAGTVTLGADVTVGGMTFNTNAYSVVPGGFGITFGAPGNINVSAGTTTISAPIGGSAITKTGGGTLRLTPANTFSGLNLDGGVVEVFGTTDSLGATGSTITVLSSSTLRQGSSGAISLNKALAVNSGTLTFVHGNSNWTIQGVVSGSGTIKVNDAGSVNQRPLVLSSTANTFTGAIDLLGSMSTTTISSIGDTVGAGNIIFGAGNSAFQLGTAAVSPLVLNNRVFEFRGGGSTGQINNNNNTAGNSMTINTNLSVTTTGAKTLRLGGVNAGSNTFAGLIENGSGTVGINKTEAGNWSLTNAANTFTGTITVAAGTLSYASAGGANPITFSNTTGAATLTYTGSGQTMSGPITASAVTSGTVNLVASGSGAINYSNTGSLGSTGALVKNLVVSGTNTDDNTLAGAWENNGAGAATLTKNGVGTWILTGANTYTGATTINAGTLAVNGSLAAGSTVTVNAGGALGGDGIINGSVIANGSVAPGNSIGTLEVGGSLTWNAGDNWVFELGPGNTADRVDVTGAFTRGSGLDGTFVFDFAASTATGTFVLVDFGSTSFSGVGAFDYTNLGGGNSGSFNLTGSQLQFVVVPEPTAMAILGVGVALLGVRYGRRRKV